MNGSVSIDAGGADPPTLEVAGWAPSDDDPCIRARNHDGRDLFTVTYGGSLGIGRNDPSHPLHLANGAHCTAGGVWTDASSRKYKEGIRDLGEEEAFAALAGLSPRRFRYRTEKDEEYTGFIAEEVPDLVATRGRDGLSAMEIAAVLTKVVQAQQKRIEEMEAEVEALKETLRSHRNAEPSKAGPRTDLFAPSSNTRARVPYLSLKLRCEAEQWEDPPRPAGPSSGRDGSGRF
jgi:hypothetical protein